MISWSIQTIPIKNLKPHPKNPRSITKDQMQHLTDLIAKFGLIDLPIVNTDMTIIGGHQRIKILKKQKVKEVNCWVPNRELTEEEVEHLLIGHNLNQGQWDWEDMANNFDVVDLLSWGFTEQQLMGITQDDEEEKAKEKEKIVKLTTCPSCGCEF
jgi:ParB-like nuclease domain